MAQEGLSSGMAVEPMSEQAEGGIDSDQTAQVTIIRPVDSSLHGMQFQSAEQVISNGEDKRAFSEKKDEGEEGQNQTPVKLVPGVVSVSMPGMSGTNLVTFPSSSADIPGITMVAFPHGAGMAGTQMQLPTIMAPGQQNLFQSQGPNQAVLSSGLSPDVGSEDAGRKREMRLLKNREAAKECRRKKKEYVRCLENRVAVLEAQNKTLIEELKQLKDLYCNKTE